MNPRPLHRIARSLPFLLLAVALPLSAGAAVKREGTWPASGDEKKVSFDFDGDPGKGLQELAKEAGWSLVVPKDVTQGAHPVHIDVDNQPADAVLDALFVDQDVVARRTGSLVVVSRAGGATAPTPPTPPTEPAVTPPPAPTQRGEDRTVMGAEAEIGRDEVVHDLTVMGGAAKIRGTVTGNLVVAGGEARLEEGAHVVGDATAFGGAIKLEKGARVDGSVGVVGGAVKREEGSIVGGQVIDQSSKKKNNVKVTVGDTPSKRGEVGALHKFGQSMTKMALLFVLGCVLLALSTRRMEIVRVETASRPMRAFAIGVVSAIALTVAIVAACITIIGIPFVVVGVILGMLLFYGAFAGVLTTFGAAVLQHRTPNPYVHLLFGCVVFLLVGAIPYVGGILTFVTAMIALGVLVSTRFGAGRAKAARPALV